MWEHRPTGIAARRRGHRAWPSRQGAVNSANEGKRRTSRSDLAVPCVAMRAVSPRAAIAKVAEFLDFVTDCLTTKSEMRGL